MSKNRKNLTKLLQQSQTKILSEKKRFYFNRGIEFILDKPLGKDIDIEKVIGLLKNNLPISSYLGINNVYFGDFEILKKRSLTALHHKDNIYVSSEELTSEKEILDDLVHEFAHRFEENNAEMIYEDGKVINEYLGKMNRLHDLITQDYDLNYFGISYFDFINTEYDSEFDKFLYEKIGYTEIQNMAPTLFIRPYAATSVREYFATGFEDFYLEGGLQLKKISPVLHSRLELLEKSTDFKFK